MKKKVKKKEQSFLVIIMIKHPTPQFFWLAETLRNLFIQCANYCDPCKHLWVLNADKAGKKKKKHSKNNTCTDLKKEIL